jgi:2-methylcitrate dehydratase PrpD
MGTVLGLIAQFQVAGMKEFDQAFNDIGVRAFRDKVTMVLDREVDSAYPVRWIGKVTVETVDGKRYEGRVDVPKGDPGNTLSREELEQKALRLADFSHAATAEEMRGAFERLWNIADLKQVGRLLP